MKKFLIASCLALTTTFFMPSAQAVEKVKVCVDVKDKKGKPVKDVKGVTKQNCKMMNKHQKLDGKKVPTKKKK